MVRDQLKDARTAFARKEFDKAFAIYKVLAEDGRRDCQVFYGWMLLEGIGCTKNEEKAILIFEKASFYEDPLGCFYYARLLTRIGEHERAFGFYKVSAKGNYLPAIFRVGFSLVRGRGVSKNLTSGYRYLISAVLRGHAFSLRELAVQDWKNGRGIVWKCLSPLEYMGFIILALNIYFLNRSSDLLRG